MFYVYLKKRTNNLMVTTKKHAGVAVNLFHLSELQLIRRIKMSELEKIQEYNRITLAKPINLTLSQIEFTKVALSQKRDNAQQWLRNHEIGYETYKQIDSYVKAITKILQESLEGK
jgi:hypothetical protein